MQRIHFTEILPGEGFKKLILAHCGNFDVSQSRRVARLRCGLSVLGDAHHFRARSQIELAAAKTIVQNASVGCMALQSYHIKIL